MLGENWAPTTYNCAMGLALLEIKRAAKEHCEGVILSSQTQVQQPFDKKKGEHETKVKKRGKKVIKCFPLKLF